MSLKVETKSVTIAAPLIAEKHSYLRPYPRGRSSLAAKMNQHGVQCSRRRRAHHFRPLDHHKACHRSTLQQQHHHFQIAPEEQILEDCNATVAARHRLDERLRPLAPSLVTESGLENRCFRERLNSVLPTMDNRIAVLGTFWGSPQSFWLSRKGLSKAAMTALPKQMYNPSCQIKGQDECPICLDAFLLGQTVINLPCRHRYHRSCLEPWLEGHSRCPYCRSKATTKKGLLHLLSFTSALSGRGRNHPDRIIFAAPN